MTAVDEGHRLGMRHWFGITGMLALRTFRLRYLRSKLGIGWALVQPLIQAAVLSLVFTKVFKAAKTEHYALYVLSGVMTWQAFSGGLNTATNAVLDNAGLLRKVAMPAVVFPAAQIASVLLVLGVQLVLLVAAALFSGTVGVEILLLPLIPVLVGVLALGAGLLTCALQVAYRDVKFLVESMLMVAFYASPVLYVTSALAPKMAHVLELNPMYGVLSLARTALLQKPFNGRALTITLIEAAVLLAVGSWVFRRRSPDFADLA